MILNDNSTQQINTLAIQLQNRITNLNNELKSLNKETSDLNSKISDLERRISSNVNDADDMNTEINNLNSKISDLERRISSLANDAAAMNTEILANTEAISGKADKSHTHTKSQITDFPTSLKNPNALTVNGKTYDGSTAVDAGVQTVENGGTGVTTQAEINKAFIANLDVGTSDVTDGTEFVSSYALDSGFSSTDEGSLHKPYKRQFVKVWNYIKNKISSVLGLTKDNYGGKASTAGTADTVDNYHASDLWRSDGATWNPSANVIMTPSGNGSEWSFDFRYKNGATGSYWQVWDENKSTLLQVNADDGKVSAPYGFVGNLSGKASTAGTADRATTADYARNMYYQYLDLSALDKTKFYPLVCYSANDFAEVAICSESGFGSMDYNQNRIHFDISTHGWNDLRPTLNIREYACYENDEITIGCIGRGIRDGAWVIWLRGGLHYTCFSRDADLSLHTSDYTFIDETYTVGTNYYGGSNTNVEVVFTPQSTITEGAYSTRPITAPRIKADIRMVIPIGAPSSLEDGCIWIEG